MLGFIRIWFFPLIYPTRSSPQQLSLVHEGDYSNRPIITLSHYIDKRHIADYILTIENGIRGWEPQVYTLPNLNGGTVEINVELGDKLNSNFTLSRVQASELLKKGLLIYVTSDNNSITREGIVFRDHYVHFIIGNNRTIYYLSGEEIAAGYSFDITDGTLVTTVIRNLEWTIVPDAPQLKKFLSGSELDYYSRWYSGWKENEWVRIDRE